MTSIRIAGLRLMAAALILAAAGWMGRPASAQTIERLYVLDCGRIEAPDKSRWSPGIDVGVPMTLSDNCYLIQHSSGRTLLWDTGLKDDISKVPDGFKGPVGLVFFRSKTLIGQLDALGLKPANIDLVAISHHHADHSGNVDLFPTATLLIQKAEYDFVMGLPEAGRPFNPNRNLMKLDGDKDVFGDGSAVILSTPGHTPGHQSLLLHLRKTGTVILSGDIAHFQSNWEHRRVPGFNWNQEKSSASMERVAEVLTKEHGTLWINHDKPTSDGMLRPPKFYE